jgi:hypothetical protein
VERPRNELDDIEDEVRDRMVEDVFMRWVNLVLTARIGNGTWDENSQLRSFVIVFPPDNDNDVRVRVNDEDSYWSHPRAARNLAEGATLKPDDLLVERLSVPSDPPSRYIRAEVTAGRWELEIQLNMTHPRRIEHLAAAGEFRESAADALERGALRAFYENAFHAAEHLAQAELLSYTPTLAEVVDAKSHDKVRSTYHLWARLGNTDTRFARLLTDLQDARSSQTYLRGDQAADMETARVHHELLDDMYEWVRGLVQDGRGPRSIQMIATQQIVAGQVVSMSELQLRPQRPRSP